MKSSQQKVIVDLIEVLKRFLDTSFFPHFMTAILNSFFKVRIYEGQVSIKKKSVIEK